MKKIKSQLGMYMKMLKRINIFLLDTKSKKLLVWLVPITVLLDQLWVLDNYILGQIVNKLSGEESIFSQFSIALCTAILIVSYVFADSVRYLLTRKGILFNNHIVNKVEKQFWSMIARIELQDRENPKVQNTIDDARRNYGAVNQIFRMQMTIIGSLLTLVASIAVLTYIEWWYLLLIVGMVIPGIYFNRLRTIKNYNQEKRLNEIRRYQWELSGHIGRKETIVHGATNYFLDLYQSIRGHFLQAKLLFEGKVNTINFISSLMRNGLMLFLYIAVFIKIDAGELQIGALFLVFSSIRKLESNLGSLLDKFVSLEQNVREANDFFAVIDMKPSIQMPACPVKIDTTISPTIEFDDVWFKYPNTETYILKGVSFKINPMEKLGLVGENGSGKTTISLLVLRFYDPQKGAIRINGIDLRLLDRDQLFSMAGVVFQDFDLFETRISETIRVHDTSQRNEKNIYNSAKKVGIDDFISSFPKKYDQKIGTFYEGGIKLSGGQRQKVAIAGIIFRDSNFVILDEPTSDLSPTSEQQIIEQYAEASKTKTGLIIFHRYKALQLVDRILVLEDGVIVEQGTHKELMAINKTYAKFFRAAQV
jgi:ABC-type multidrug transport system fused ATPase/permease subunit